MKEKSIQNIVFISNNYPTKNHVKYTFVEQIVNEIEKQGIECIVIAPQSITNGIFREGKILPLKYIFPDRNITVYRPLYITFSNILPTINRLLFVKTVENIFKRLIKKPDIIYGHFIRSSGIAAVKIGKKYNIPSFIASGESSLYGLSKINKKYLRNIFKLVNGIISVSTENKKYLTTKGYVKENKIVVLPNSVDNNIFYKRDRKELREKLGFNKNDFIVAFVGHFDQRKGSLRLSQALSNIDGIKSIFIGKGSNIPDCPGILFCGSVEHGKVPEYLCASDVFVLPTLAEGCCNAIIEAMACGLPIISSNLPCNKDILKDSYAIRINPNSIAEITEAIKLLRDNNVLRDKMAAESELESKKYLISNRAIKIIDYINQNIDR